MWGRHTMSPSAGASQQLPTVFGPLNKCVYCGAEPPTPLTKEHVLPQGLGGGIILLKSSCDPCRKITQKFEETTLRKMYLPYRFRAGLVQSPHELSEPLDVQLM